MKPTTNSEEGSYTLKLRMSTPNEMVQQSQKELAQTPRRKFLKRMQLKRNIEFWGNSEGKERI